MSNKIEEEAQTTKIVVMHDGETWEQLNDGIKIYALTPAQMRELEEGATPRQLEDWDTMKGKSLCWDGTQEEATK